MHYAINYLYRLQFQLLPSIPPTSTQALGILSPCNGLSMSLLPCLPPCCHLLLAAEGGTEAVRSIGDHCNLISEGILGISKIIDLTYIQSDIKMEKGGKSYSIDRGGLREIGREVPLFKCRAKLAGIFSESHIIH